MRASIRQVAERAQVSRMTVSRVLQGRKKLVNPETYARVLAVVRELDYVPVRPALQNYQLETKTIALVPYCRNPSRSIVDSKTFEGLCDTAYLHGYDLFIMLRGEAEWMAKREELRFLDRRSDGFIFISPSSGERHTALQTLVEHKIPAVVCYQRDVPAGIPWVDPDNEGIINLAVDHLLQQGHSSLIYLSGPQSTIFESELLANLPGQRSNYDNIARIKHFEQRLRDMGKKEPEKYVLYISSPDWCLTPNDVQTILKMAVTGVICDNIYAIQLWDEVEALGKKIPDDLSIISIDNQIEAANRGLTSIGFGYDAVGMAAVEAWIEFRSSGDAAKSCKVIPVKLVERASVGAPSSSS